MVSLAKSQTPLETCTMDSSPFLYKWGRSLVSIIWFKTRCQKEVTRKAGWLLNPEPLQCTLLLLGSDKTPKFLFIFFFFKEKKEKGKISFYSHPLDKNAASNEEYILVSTCSSANRIVFSTVKWTSIALGLHYYKEKEKRLGYTVC